MTSNRVSRLARSPTLRVRAQREKVPIGAHGPPSIAGSTRHFPFEAKLRRQKKRDRLADLTRRPLPALRTYLAAQTSYRVGRYVRAESLFARALEIDSTFGLAGLGHGTGLMKVEIAPEGQPVVNITAPTTTADLSFLKDKSKPYPVTGTVTAVVTSIRTGSPATTTTQVTTYDGSAIAKLVITLPGGGKRTCTYDMTAPPAPANCTGP